jgi:hypothetical protein
MERPSTNFIAAFLFGIAGTAFFALYGSDLPKTSYLSGTETQVRRYLP